MHRRTRNTMGVMMMVTLAAMLGSMAVLSGCSDEHQHHAETDQPPETRPADEPAEARPEASGPVGRLVVVNYDLVEALSSDDPERSRQAAADARRALERIDDAMLQVSVQEMDRALEQLVDAADLPDMRTAFEPFSHELIEVVRAHGTDDAGLTRVAHCWMVNDGDAYWLAHREEITNPYHGTAMYRCGRIVETLGE